MSEYLRSLADVHDEDGFPEDARDIRKAADELDRLQGIVGKLPKTADGVSIVPVDDTVWHPVFGECVTIAEKMARPWVIKFYENVIPVSDCYSTKDAAEAANSQGKGGV
jgi:hypothetical protein